MSAARTLGDDPDALASAFAGADILYFSGITLAILTPRPRGRLMKAIVNARNAGAQVVFDPNVRPALWSSKEVMASTITAAATIADLVLPTHTDEAPLFGDASANGTADRYLSLGVGEVAVKNGPDFAVVGNSTRRYTVKPQGSPKVVDPTGAGDSFNGAYLAARIQGKSPDEAARAAHRVAGIVIGHKGALVDPALVAV
jgi:2-dehydro-3-deoxygluconokinase